MKRVLITGASIAGPTVAWWLSHYGMEVTVVERAQEFRDGGQTVDIRGASRTVVQRMQLEDSIRSRAVHEEAWAYVDEKDRILASFGANEFGGEGPTAELEILRGDLARVIMAASKDSVEYFYGDSIESLRDNGDSTLVRFASGNERTFDLVIIAEGIGSRTRQMIWGDEAQKRPFNLYTAYFTIPKGPTDTEVARWFNTVGGRCVFLRPDNTGTTRAVFNFLCKPYGLEKQPASEQKRAFREKFANAGWETPRVLDGMEQCTDWYMESIGQMKVKTWSKNNVVLVGDAAYCASPLSGMGTALALVGSYVLAGEIATAKDLPTAFKNYESLMRPYVDKAQGIPSFAPRLGQPMTRVGLFLQRLALRIISSRPLRRLVKLFNPPADKIELPDYSQRLLAN